MAEDHLSGGSNGSSSRSVFISYRRLDDDPPPENPDGGFVRHLSHQIRWELNQLGVPDAILWRDRAKIDPGDDWSEVILKELQKADLFLAIVSRNYVQSSWCNIEVSTMASRVALPNHPHARRRIFRVDKHRVPGDQIPEPLRAIQPVRFYEEDRETTREDEFFWRGKVRKYDAYVGAIHELAVAIYERLEALGIPMKGAKPSQAAQPSANTRILSTERVIFVAKPAGDVSEEYRTLTRELTQRNCRVVPDPNSDLPNDGEGTLAIIRSALSEVEFSIHLIGERRGFRPDGMNDDLVPLQLSAAAKEAERKPNFQRLIWAPKVLPRSPGGDTNGTIRDPFDVLSRFGTRLPSDQIDGDTAARFNEFVLQRISNKSEGYESGAVYVHCVPSDRAFAVAIARELKKLGLAPLIRPQSDETSLEEARKAEERLLSRSQHSVLCWGTASQAQMFAELTDPMLRNWKSQKPTARRVIVLIGPPITDGKRELYELGMGPDADCLIDASDPMGLSKIISTQLAPAVGWPK